METICQSLESVFAGLKRREIDLTPSLFDTLHRSVDMLNAITLSPPEEAAAGAGEISRITEKLATAAMGEIGEKQAIPDDRAGPPGLTRGLPNRRLYLPAWRLPVRETDETARMQKKAASDTLRISVEKMDALLRQGEEMLSVKLMADQHLEDIHDLIQMFGIWQKQWSKIYPTICEFRRLQERNDKQGKKRRKDDKQNLRF